MPDKDNLVRFAEFARAVNARLEAGRASYNAKTSAGASPAASGGI